MYLGQGQYDSDFSSAICLIKYMQIVNRGSKDSTYIKLQL